MQKFKAATWNMGGGEGNGGPTLRQTEEVLVQLRRIGVSVLLGQEVQENENIQLLKKLGYQTYRARPESVVAWIPEVWTMCAKHDRVLNPTTPFHRKDNPKDIFIHMAHCILCTDEGVSIDAGSYHTPSSVQERVQPKNRIAALRESMETLSELNAESKCDATLFGGDDNVDEDGAFGPWDFMLYKATGLRQIQAPKNTLGKRRVDDFRVRGLRRDGDGRVIHGPTHHNAFMQSFVLPR